MKKTMEERIKLNENQVEYLRKERENEQVSMREKITQLDG